MNLLDKQLSVCGEDCFHAIATKAVCFNADQHQAAVLRTLAQDLRLYARFFAATATVL
jgi:hypothetical protein